jgi:hypothetical protein
MLDELERERKSGLIIVDVIQTIEKHPAYGMGSCIRRSLHRTRNETPLSLEA